MDEHLIFEGKRYASSIAAAKHAGYTNDYVARLCRQGKVRGKMVGKTWYVEENSFFSYLIEANKKKELNKRSLSEKRQEEYREAPKEKAPVLPPFVVETESDDEWTESARRQARRLQYAPPARALALSLAVAVVLAGPLLFASVPRGLVIVGDSFLAKEAGHLVRTATRSDSVDALLSALRTEKTILASATADVAFQTQHQSRSLRTSVSSLSAQVFASVSGFSLSSVRPGGYYAAVLEAVATSEKITIDINISALKKLFSETLSFVREKISLWLTVRGE